MQPLSHFEVGLLVSVVFGDCAPGAASIGILHRRRDSGVSYPEPAFGPFGGGGNCDELGDLRVDETEDYWQGRESHDREERIDSLV